MIILTLDLEEWAIVLSIGLGSDERHADYDVYHDSILAVLDERRIKGTFFCTRMRATEFPQA